MYGTVGVVPVKAENRERMLEIFREQAKIAMPGYRSMQVMFPDNRPDEMVIAVWFDDRASYHRNADDPAQDARYQEFAALFAGEPEWHDGDWIEP